MKDEDGGPAFPSSGPAEAVSYWGMSLRDYFAAQLLAGVFSGGDTDWDDAIMARRAYAMADAMLMARHQ